LQMLEAAWLCTVRRIHDYLYTLYLRAIESKRRRKRRYDELRERDDTEVRP